MTMTGNSMAQIGRPWCGKPTGSGGAAIGKKELEQFGTPWDGKPKGAEGKPGKTPESKPKGFGPKDELNLGSQIRRPDQAQGSADPRTIYKPTPIKTLDDLIKSVQNQPDPRMYQE